MGNARQQLLAALLIPAGTLHGCLQPGGHLVESIAHGGELVLPGIDDPVLQISLSQTAGAFAQQIERLLDPADHKAGEKAVGHQNGQEHDKGQPDECQREDDLQSAVQMLLPGSEEIQNPCALSVRAAGPIHAARSGGDKDLCFAKGVRGLRQPAVLLQLVTHGIGQTAVLHHDNAEAAGLRHGLQAAHPAGPRVRSFVDPALKLAGHVPAHMREIISVLQAHNAAALKREPEQGHAQQADQGYNGRGDCNHQDIGTEQALLDGHAGRLPPVPDIIAHFSMRLLNCE